MYSVITLTLTLGKHSYRHFHDDIITWKCFTPLLALLSWESMDHQWVSLTEGQWMQEFDVYFIVSLNNFLPKQSIHWWFEMLIWHHHNLLPIYQSPGSIWCCLPLGVLQLRKSTRCKMLWWKYSWLKNYYLFRQNYQYLLQYMWQLKCSLHDFIWTKWFINTVLYIPFQLSCPLPSYFNGWMKKHGFLNIFIVGNQKRTGTQVRGFPFCIIWSMIQHCSCKVIA